MTEKLASNVTITKKQPKKQKGVKTPHIEEYEVSVNGHIIGDMRVTQNGTDKDIEVLHFESDNSYESIVSEDENFDEELIKLANSMASEHLEWLHDLKTRVQAYLKILMKFV